MKSLSFFVLTCLMVPLAALSQENKDVWYLSDASGMMNGTTDGPTATGWSLLVSRTGSQEREQLHENGLPVKTWIRTYDKQGRVEREALEQDGTIREENIYDGNGFLSVERRFGATGDVENTVYSYVSGRLISKTVSLDDTTVKIVSYLYAPDGRLAAARESTGDYFATSSSVRGISYSWKLIGDNVELNGYDKSGRLVTVSVYEGAELVSNEKRTWKDGILERTVLTEGAGSSTETEYETQGAATGKPLLTATSSNGKLVLTERRAYDAEGRISELEILSGSSTSLSTYIYDGDGKLTMQSDSKDGILVTTTKFESPATRIEESWDNGMPFARVRFEDGRKVLEEIMMDGVVVRSRSFD